MTEQECFDKIKEYKYLKDSFENSLIYMKYPESIRLTKMYIKDCEIRINTLEEMLFLGECEDSHDL